MRRPIPLIPLTPLILMTAYARALPADAVPESARGIPIAYAVDVVVAGGSTGAVSAAVAAAERGARVFLAAPYPYLGEDMTATLRTWLEEGEVPESPLAKALFSERREPALPFDPATRLPLTYETDLPSAGVHRDTSPPGRLTDGMWGGASAQSVQYDGDVAITATLDAERDLGGAFAMVYHANDFQVDLVTVYTSRDGKEWIQVARIANDAGPQARVDEPALILAAPISGKARHVRFAFRRAAGATRILVGEIAVTGSAPRVEPAPAAAIPPATPFHVKKVLDEALIAAKVPYLYSSYVTDVLRDARGDPCGVVMANRAGRQAVVAKVIIDGTDRAWIARKAGGRARAAAPGERTLGFVVIGGTPKSGDGMKARTVSPPFFRAGKSYDIIEYALRIPVEDESWASWARAEQIARDRTYDPDQQFTSDAFFSTPAGAVEGRVPRIHVIDGRGPLERIDAGARIGAAAADEAKGLPEPRGVRVPGTGGEGAAGARGDVRENLTGVRPVQNLPAVLEEARGLPVLGSYDVVVIGGGTSGAPAGIGAARHGARTLVVEYLHGLGGVGTEGAISSYYWGNRVGFSAEVGGGSTRWIIEQKKEWYRKALRDAGAEIWFGAMGVGSYVVGTRVAGAVVATPAGRGVVLADVVIDATGGADIAASAGAACMYTDASDIAMQGTGLPPRRLGESYTNTDFTIVDETDMLDIWRTFVSAKYKQGSGFDLGKLIDTRERRRIAGEATITILDVVNERTHPDTIVEAYSDFDTHGYTIDPYFTLDHPPARKGFRISVPYRALLPKGLDGILVVGLGMSAHRDAVPVIRMQADLQNQGYAAGIAAAMAAKAGVSTRGIDIRALQKHLVEIGNLSERVLEDRDSYPLPDERIAAAVEAVREDYEDVAAILASPERALPLLRKAYAGAEGEKEKRIYAHVLAVLGDPTGVETLIAAVEAMSELDEGWRYKGMGQFGPNMSPLDRLIYALGCTGDRRAVPAIAAKAKLLRPESEFSHFRAVALALERIGDPAAAGALAEVLALPGVRGHARATIEGVIEEAKRYPSWNATEPRSNSIRELMLGRALFLCGDRDGLGRGILEAYEKDLRGHLSRHSNAILRGPER
ncbi:MAG: FAD-dependent oxidoreductase [Planctomycetes bacterium]|nr:FAD-dependent oxidoreductase [Planctomycetota bacterium]